MYEKPVIFILLISTLVLLINSCKRDDSKPQQTSFPVPQEVKDYMYFKPGTYWIYQDSVSGDLDTVTVTDTVVASKSDNGNYYEHYETRTYSSRDKYYYYYKINTSFSDRCINLNENRPCYTIMGVKTKPGNYVGELAALFLPFQKGYGGNQYISSNVMSEIKITDKINNYSDNNNTFIDVIVVKSTNNRLFVDKDVQLFFARNTGIVRKEIIQDSTTPICGNLLVTMSYNS